MRQQNPLTNEALMHAAPSIFATKPWKGMSDRYTFIPTIDIIEKMRAEGFFPFSASQAKCRIAEKTDFTKHLIRFRDARESWALGLDLYPEIVLTNSHDGASCYRLDAGIFRCVCINGLVSGDTLGDQVKVRHSGNADGIIEASYDIVNQFPKLLDTVERFHALQLTPAERLAYGRAALELKYSGTASPISAKLVTAPRRSADADPNLWNTFNVVQENLVQGGLRGWNADTHRRLRTRAVTGISENVKLNKALWTLTDDVLRYW